MLKPPDNDLYEAIKERMINCFADTEHKKLKNLLHDLDSKSSDLFIENVYFLVVRYETIYLNRCGYSVHL